MSGWVEWTRRDRTMEYARRTYEIPPVEEPRRDRIASERAGRADRRRMAWTRLAADFGLTL